jgi:hypothetical protein
LNLEENMEARIVGRGTNRLSDRAAQAFIARHRVGRPKRTKLSDGGGMFLTMTPAGAAVWRLK